MIIDDTATSATDTGELHSGPEAGSVLIGSVEHGVRELRYAGHRRPRPRPRSARHRYREFSSAGQFVGWAIARIADGVVATYRGRLREAIAAFEQSLAALDAESSLPWKLPARLLLARAYAALI